MIALIQRVNRAKVESGQRLLGETGRGLLAFIGIEKDDDEVVAVRLLEKVLAYRVFADASGKMNLSVRDVDGGLLLVSQFTLAATTDKGLRPGFSSAKPPGPAQRLYEYLVSQARQRHQPVASGEFGATMQVTLQNDGPVTFFLKIPSGAS